MIRLSRKAFRLGKARRPLVVVGAIAVLTVIGQSAASGMPMPQPYDRIATTGPVTAQPAPAGPRACTVSAKLVNSCRPWLGAAANGYPNVGSGVRAQLEAHEQRIGAKVDLVHVYAPVGHVPLDTADARYFATRANTYLFQNWKPADTWKAATGGDPTVEARIDKAADNIKALGSKKIFLTLHHEPENDVTTGSAGSCATKSGAKTGSPADYRAMWKHIHDRFAAKGVTNVVWVVDYMNYPKWDCLVPKLYPGDAYVDWVMFNGYAGSSLDFTKNIEHFTGLLTAMDQNDGTHTAGKPWGVVEWSIQNSTQAQAYAYYDQARADLTKAAFARIKAYMVFDSPGPENASGLRVAYDDAGHYDATELQHYKAFAHAVLGT